jgi:ABC-2 type transport system ATP-binding protein
MSSRDESPVLEVRELVKDFGSFRAVDGISFSVPRGSIVGFLGPNGAGKTTTIHMLLGITDPSGGEIRYFGKNFAHERQACLQRINAASAFNTLLGRISVRENLLVFAHLYLVEGAERTIDALLERFEIAQLASQLYWHLSAGQRTRVNLIKSLLNDPEIVLMDEPTASLDPDIADKTLSLIEDLRRERGLSILYTSHNMGEISRICDEVIFLDHGKIVAKGTPESLTRRIGEATLVLAFSAGKDEMERYLRGREIRFSFTGAHTLEVQLSEESIPDVLFGLSHAGGRITDIEIRKPTLEDVFLRIARTAV